MTHVAVRVEFSTDRFALTGELPPEVNAGNRFYGEDLAKYLCESLAQAVLHAVQQLSVVELNVTQVELDSSGNERHETPYVA
jgi:hypothetical protein